MSISAIAASGLRKAYGDKVVLDGIDLDVAAGTVATLSTKERRGAREPSGARCRLHGCAMIMKTFSTAKTF